MISLSQLRFSCAIFSSQTSCNVNVDFAGKIAYEISSPQRRIFYRIKNEYSNIHLLILDVDMFVEHKREVNG